MENILWVGKLFHVKEQIMSYNIMKREILDGHMVGLISETYIIIVEKKDNLNYNLYIKKDKKEMMCCEGDFDTVKCTLDGVFQDLKEINQNSNIFRLKPFGNICEVKEAEKTYTYLNDLSIFRCSSCESEGCSNKKLINIYVSDYLN